MVVAKSIILFIIFFICIKIGFNLSNKYKQRVIELREIKSLLNMLKIKIQFTYEPLPIILKDLQANFKDKIYIFIENINKNINELSVGEAWKYSIENSNLNLNEEDKSILVKLGNLLGKTDINGQTSEIEVIEKFLNSQIGKAEEEKKKNEKMYKSLGIICGIVIVIILI